MKSYGAWQAPVHGVAIGYDLETKQQFQIEAIWLNAKTMSRAFNLIFFFFLNVQKNELYLVSTILALGSFPNS